MGFTQPHLHYGELSPVLIVFGSACVGVLVEAFVPRRRRFTLQVALTLVTLASALSAAVVVGTRLAPHRAASGAVARGIVGAEGSMVIDGPTVCLWALVLVFAFGATALFAERRLGDGQSSFVSQAAATPGSEQEREASRLLMEHTEVYPLLLLAVGGMLVFPAAGDLVTMFVALEVLSLPLYLLSGLARHRRLLSQEAALKYLVLGAFSSSFFLYGAALVYGYAGSMSMAGLNNAVRGDAQNHGLLVAGIGLLSVGLLFKVGAVPFHAWVPDVYQGAPTPVTAFMAVTTKVVAFGALLRLFYVGLDGERWNWEPMLWVVAILSMVFGAVVAVAQADVKRMLAYSSVSHTGFLLTGVLGAQSAGDLAPGQYSSLVGVVVYLASYGFATQGAFAVLMLVRESGTETTSFSGWTGLGRRSPLAAGAFALFLVSMAGIPMTAGFVGKWAVFTSAMSAGAWPVVMVALAASVIGAFVYMRLIRLMFFTAAPSGAAGTVTRPSPLTAGTVAACAVGTIVLGVLPGPLLSAVGGAGGFIR